MSNGESRKDLFELASSVLLNYDIIPDSIKIIQNKRLKTLWKFSYNDEVMCLKRLRHTVDKALFSVNAQIYIYNKGGNVPRIYLNSKGDAITEYMNQLFVLYGWIDGRDLNFSKLSDLSLAVEGLSKFHRASVGYRPPENARVSYKLGKWPEQYRSMQKRMTEWKDLALLKEGQPGYSCYLKYVDSITQMADTAIDALQESSYNLLTGIEFYQSPLCHQDYGEGNALLSEQEVYVLDLDGVTYDLPVRDLRKLTGKRMEDTDEWKEDMIESILGWYERNNTLSKQEKELLKIDLLFPHWFFGVVKNLFKKNKHVKDSKIQRVARLEQSKLSILQDLF